MSSGILLIQATPGTKAVGARVNRRTDVKMLPSMPARHRMSRRGRLTERTNIGTSLPEPERNASSRNRVSGWVARELSARFFATEQGNEPVRDWLQEFSTPEKRVLGEDLRTVQTGWPIGMPLVEKLEKDLWEVRSILPAGIARILFTVVDGEMLLLHGFVKKSRKIPKRDIDLARRRMKQARK